MNDEDFAAQLEAVKTEHAKVVAELENKVKDTHKKLITMTKRVTFGLSSEQRSQEAT